MFFLDFAPFADHLRGQRRRFFTRIPEAQEHDYDEFWVFPSPFGGDKRIGIERNRSGPDVFVNLRKTRGIAVQIIENFRRARLADHLVLE